MTEIDINMPMIVGNREELRKFLEQLTTKYILAYTYSDLGDRDQEEDLIKISTVEDILAEYSTYNENFPFEVVMDPATERQFKQHRYIEEVLAQGSEEHPVLVVDIVSLRWDVTKAVRVLSFYKDRNIAELLFNEEPKLRLLGKLIVEANKDIPSES